MRQNVEKLSQIENRLISINRLNRIFLYFIKFKGFLLKINIYKKKLLERKNKFLT